jgi:hypothetical protein
MSTAVIKPFYAHLKKQGFEKSYVRDAMLPDWWDDALFENPSNRLTAQMSVAKYLGVRLQDIINENAVKLHTGNVRLKRGRAETPSEVLGAVTAALHAARMTASLMRKCLPFTGMRNALEVRNQLLSHPESPGPNLNNLLDYCWQHGIGVVHVTRMPKVPGAKKIEGLATFVGDRPVIVLCSGRSSPAWLAFHLAHELGHIMREHVKAGDQPLIDIKLENVIDDADETEANQYAFQVLTGSPDPKFSGKISSSSVLVAAARKYGELNHVDPGTVALIYGYSQKCIPMAQAALKKLEVNSSGAAQLIATAFREHAVLENVPESIQRSLSTTTQIYGMTLPENSNA